MDKFLQVNEGHEPWLAMYLSQQVIRMNRLGEDIEVVTFGTGFLQQFRSTGLAGEKEHTAFGVGFAEMNSKFQTCHARHYDI